MTKIDGVTDITTDPIALTCSFKTTNPEIENLLAKAAETNEKLAEYSIVE